MAEPHGTEPGRGSPEGHTHTHPPPHPPPPAIRWHFSPQGTHSPGPQWPAPTFHSGEGDPFAARGTGVDQQREV